MEPITACVRGGLARAWLARAARIVLPSADRRRCQGVARLYCGTQGARTRRASDDAADAHLGGKLPQGLRRAWGKSLFCPMRDVRDRVLFVW